MASEYTGLQIGAKAGRMLKAHPRIVVLKDGIKVTLRPTVRKMKGRYKSFPPAFSKKTAVIYKLTCKKGGLLYGEMWLWSATILPEVDPFLHVNYWLLMRSESPLGIMTSTSMNTRTWKVSKKSLASWRRVQEAKGKK